MASRLAVIRNHLAEPNPTSAAVQSQFRYTVDQGCLTTEEREQYERDGFVVKRGLIPQSDLDRYADRFKKICSGEVDSSNMTLMRDVAIAKSEFKAGERAITKLQNFQDDEVLFEYLKHPEVMKVVTSFLGENIMAMHTMVINKPPDPGTRTSRHPMHQDLHYFSFRPADRIVCSWTAMQHIDRTNGCLVVIPGSHRNPGVLMEHGYPDWEKGVNKMYYGIQNYQPKEGDRVHLTMEPGDTVFFHPLLIHGSGTNRSQGFRKSISSHYAASECEYIDVQGTSQQMLQDEIHEVAKCKLFGKDAEINADMMEFLKKEITLSSHWSAKARCVHGKKVNI
jgi:phytanoyl-CoA hydroxylase